MIQQVLAEPLWQGRLTAPDRRALTPLKWQHVNPYGTFTLNMSERLALAWIIHEAASREQPPQRLPRMAAREAQPHLIRQLQDPPADLHQHAAHRVQLHAR